MPAEAKPAVSDHPVRGKGRPRVTSRDKIVEVGLSLAAAAPSTSISIASIARELGIAPMAIYNYFPNRDSLMQELSARLLDRMKIEIVPGAHPLKAIEIWARSARAHFLKYPELLWIIGYENGYSSDAWFAKSKALFEAMEALGLTGDEVVKAIRWFWNVVMSAITVEIQDVINPVKVDEDVDERFDSYTGERFLMLNEAFRKPSFYDDMFDFNLEMVAHALKARVNLQEV